MYGPKFTCHVKDAVVVINSSRYNENTFFFFFFKYFATSLVDLLFIEHMLHLSHVKQMYSQTMHLTHELKLCIQMIRRRVSLTEIPRWRILAGAEFQTATFRPRFLALQPHLPYRVLAIFMAPHGRAHSSGQCSGGPHWSDHQQAIWNTVEAFTEPACLEAVCCPSAWLTCFHNVFLSAELGTHKRASNKVPILPSVS